MATEYWTDIQPGVEFELRFRTDNREYFRFVEEAARACIDGLVPDGVRLERKQATKQATSEKASDKTSEWISVEDRLPDLIPCNAGTAYSEAVIIWTSGRKALIGVFDGDDFLCAADYWEAEGEEITHWMPLPELPKEEK